MISSWLEVLPVRVRSTDIAFTEQESAYLRTQHLGRLATVDRAGAPQNNPVGHFLDREAGQIIIGGRQLGTSRKFRNVRHNGVACLVVDDSSRKSPGRSEVWRSAGPRRRRPRSILPRKV